MIDPFCGTGGFLIESFRYIFNNMARTEANLKTLRESTVYGNEITNTARITKMNMILAGDGHSNIEMKDSLANPVDGTATYTDEKGVVHHNGFDIVLANMPYSQKTKHGSLYDLPSSNGDSICVQHCMKAINSASENGRMALVVPEGFLFRKDLTKTREYLLDHCQLQSIISLPQGVFLPYTGVKTDIIYATKVNQTIKAAEKKKDFWYFDVKSDGYTLDNHRRKLETPSDLSKYEEYRKLDKEQAADMMRVGFEIIPLDKVRRNANILVGSKYREQPTIVSKYDIVKLEDVVSVANGFAFPLALQGQEGDTPFYKVSDMNSVGNEIEMRYSNNYVSADMIQAQKWKIAPRGTIIFPKIGAAIATNKKRILTQESIFDNNVMGLICSDRILPKYLWYILNAIDISTWASRSNPPSIARDSVLSQQIPLPPIDIQIGIVNELDGYQRVISGAQDVLVNYRPTISCKAENHRPLSEIALFKPSKEEVKDLPGETEVSFVPMSCINTYEASFTATETRSLRDVLTGFTYFKDKDVLLAKITPCFENGKAGIAHNLKNGIGFGSTEFIVIRADISVVDPEWIFYHINTCEFIDGGKSFMTGTAGQQRIDLNYVKQYKIPVPALEEQQKILDGIHREQALIESSKEIIKTFSEKIASRIKEIWGE